MYDEYGKEQLGFSLEQRVYSCMHIPGRSPNECTMCHADLMSGGGSSGMYTPNYNDIGSSSDFVASPSNVTKQIDLGAIDVNAVGFGLEERYDFSDHNTPGLDIKPHLNQSVVDLDRLNKFDAPEKIYTGIKSNKNEDGLKGLGEAHSIPLFPQFKPYKDI